MEDQSMARLSRDEYVAQVSQELGFHLPAPDYVQERIEALYGMGYASWQAADNMRSFLKPADSGDSEHET
jgi:hypothetical protein